MRKTSFALLLAAACASAAPAVAVEPAANSKPVNNQFWWPNKLDLSPLRQHAAESNPQGVDFDYAKAFAQVDLKALKQDIKAVLTTTQDW